MNLYFGECKIKPLQNVNKTYIPSISVVQLLSCEPPTPPSKQTNIKSRYITISECTFLKKTPLHNTEDF